jgi:hypothetical protein
VLKSTWIKKTKKPKNPPLVELGEDSREEAGLVHGMREDNQNGRKNLFICWHFTLLNFFKMKEICIAFSYFSLVSF